MSGKVLQFPIPKLLIKPELPTPGTSVESAVKALKPFISNLGESFEADECRFAIFIVDSPKVVITAAAIEILDSRLSVANFAKVKKEDRMAKYKYPYFNVLVMGHAMYRADKQIVDAMAVANRTCIFSNKSYDFRRPNTFVRLGEY